ncbi:MAG: hypothetical protein U5K69_13490 [Balneolaceae bacterium]|nr:hypothetical protein [Balneolaceae bacterium]
MRWDQESITQIPWWLMLLSVLTAEITEEILFRGYARSAFLNGPTANGLVHLSLLPSLQQ